MNILSLFDGMSCGRIALNRAGVKVDNYFASEVKPFAVNFVCKHFENTVPIGDVNKVKYCYGETTTRDGESYNGYYLDTENGIIPSGKIDMLIGGSPCQDFSTAKAFNNPTSYGLEGDKSKLFYQYLRILKEIQQYHPVYFLLENVKMKKDSERMLNEYMGVDGLHLNSKLVSYQLRDRIYWTNIPNIPLPEDRNINFQNFKDTNKTRLDEAKLNNTPSRQKMWGKGIHEGKFSCYNVTNEEKVHCLTRKQDRCPNSGLIEYEDFCRFLTRRELEGAQTVPYGYTDDLSYANMQDVCGDGWTVDSIAYIFSHLPEEYKDYKEQLKEEENFKIFNENLNDNNIQNAYSRQGDTKNTINIQKYNTGYLVYFVDENGDISNKKMTYSFMSMVEEVSKRVAMPIVASFICSNVEKATGEKYIY